MAEIIYDNKSEEYQSYGYYIIDGKNYYSIKQFKDDNAVEDNYSEQNSIDGEGLNSIFRISRYKTVPEEGNLPFVLVYLEEQLIDYFKL